MSAVVNQPQSKLRPMNLDDLLAVIAIEQDVYDFPWPEGIFSDCLHVGYCCWVVVEGNRVVGYSVMSIGAQEAHILNLCISKGHQQCGFGTSLLTYLIDLACEHNARTASLEVRPSNEVAIKLYKKFGFREVGRRKNYYPAKDGREDAVVLSIKI